ncbi:MAG: hypothetical protein JJU29_03945 [Verrucomicrobia bacterium]|nr:hypothetical protein [Verrucomicrobiota bacterium]MCH8512171.1 hypothetical protein [Kiritimatiellia bacterium]
MKTLLIWLMLFGPGVVRGGAEFWQITLRGGEEIQGVFLEEASEMLHFQPRWSADPLRFSPDELRSGFRIRKEPSPPSPPHRLTFANGDEISGTVTRIDGTHLHIDLPWGQSLSANRKDVLGLEVLAPKEHRLADGIIALPEAFQDPPGSEPSQTLRIGNELHLLNESSKSFSLPLPALNQSFVIDFRVRGGHQEPRYNLTFFASRPGANRELGSMLLLLQRNQLRLVWRPANIPSMVTNFSVTLPMDVLPSQHWRVAYDHKSAGFRLSVNGILVDEWLHPEDGEAGFLDPSWIRLNLLADTTLVVDLFQVQSFPHGPPPELPPASEVKSGERVLLQNTDQYAGEILGMEEGVLTMKTPAAGTLNLPLRVISGIRFSANRRPRTPENTMEVRLGPARSRLTLSNVRFDGKTLQGEATQLDQPVRIDLDEIDLILF